MPRRKAPTAVCPNTGITVPECSCDRCLEEQIRRHMPVLLEREIRVTRAPQRGLLGRLRRRPRAIS